MSDNDLKTIKSLLENNEIKDIVSNKNKNVMERLNYKPPLCEVFKNTYTITEDKPEYKFNLDREVKRILPDIVSNPVQKIIFSKKINPKLKTQFLKKRKIGVAFSGGPAPGGHNVIAGLFDAAKKANPENEIYGFILGPDGIIENNAKPLTQELVDQYRNLGGFTMIKTGRTKIDTKYKMQSTRQSIKKINIDAIMIVGGDDSNTNAAYLAQEFFESGIQVIGVPKTIDGDLQVKTVDGEVLCAASFGFHSAARSFSNNISNLSNDGSSDVKYWHVCKVMGRVASHLALEVALQTHANLTLIGEELADYVDKKKVAKALEKGDYDYTAYGLTLRHLSRVICDSVIKRAAVGKNYGVAVIPEGVLEFINEIQTFIIKLNSIIAQYDSIHDIDFHAAFPRLEDKQEYLRRLVRGIRKDVHAHIWNHRDNELFNDIPHFFQEGLLTKRDSHGNFQFSLVKTEKILIKMVKDYLNILEEKGLYKIGIKKTYFEGLLKTKGLDPDYFGPIIFRNYNDGNYLLINTSIISNKTLKNTLIHHGAILEDESVPGVIQKVYEKSVPDFKTQNHFYGYDGRGADPTMFDCNYTYNLGYTAFSLITSGATGQMAAIKNLEKNFEDWEPIGIPIAPLMHLEERTGKMSLVIEKSVVDIKSNAFKIVKALREEWLAATPGDDNFRRPGPVCFSGESEEPRPITLTLNALGKD